MSRDIEIEKGVPIPPIMFRGRPRLSEPRYPFDKMDVGDCITVPVEVNGDRGEQYYLGRMGSSIYAQARHYGKKEKGFAIRRFPEEMVVRCWRVK